MRVSRTKLVTDLAASDIVETVPSALLVLDRNLYITSANRAFYQTFRTSRSETEGCLIYDLGNRQWDIPALRTLLESVIPLRASVEGFEVELGGPGCSDRISAAISGGSAGVRLPSGSAGCSVVRSMPDRASCRRDSNAVGGDCRDRDSGRCRSSRPRLCRRRAGRPPRI